MTTAIRKHLADFVAVIALFAIAIGVGGYILAQERLRFPFIEKKPFELKAEFPDAQAVVSGQGQTVRVAGVKVGDIGTVEVSNGKALVTMNMDPGYEDLVHKDATALLRAKTGLKDMFIELDPGTRDYDLFKEGGTIPVKNTSPDVDPDEILTSLDTDTRSYLQLLLNGLGKGLKGRGNDLREVFRRLEPLHRDIARITKAIAQRRTNLARLVHNYSSLINELADKDHELTRLVTASNAVFEAFASQDTNISAAVSKLPGTLNETSRTLAKVDRLGQVLGPALESLRPAFRQLDATNRQVLPFVREAEPILRTQIRPFVRAARPVVRDLGPAARDLAAAQPDLTRAFKSFNRLVDMLAFNPAGDPPYTPEKGSAREDTSTDPNKTEGYLFWLGWVAQDTVSLFSTSDASGPFRRALFSASCDTIADFTTMAPTFPLAFGVSLAQLQAAGIC
jgi:phospholipid/cholesterol/gamma-HCH transport system substrate-binding protein